MPSKKTSKTVKIAATDITSLNDLLTPPEYERVEINLGHGALVSVYLRPLSAGAVVDFIGGGGGVVIGEDGKAKPTTDLKSQQDAMLRLMAATVCTKDGVLLVSDGDFTALRQLPVTVYNELQSRILTAIVEGNELGKDSAAPILATSTGDSPTVSLSPSVSGT